VSLSKQKCGRQAASAACNAAMVGTGRFELPTPRTPSDLATFSLLCHGAPLGPFLFDFKLFEGNLDTDSRTLCLPSILIEGPHKIPHTKRSNRCANLTPIVS
jgi:hypothetical protein